MTEAQEAPPPAKVDPETLELRSRPARTIRFRRGAIIGVAALGSASLMGIAWMALKPQVFNKVAQESELSQPMAKPASRDRKPKPAATPKSSKFCAAVETKYQPPMQSAVANRSW